MLSHRREANTKGDSQFSRGSGKRRQKSPRAGFKGGKGEGKIRSRAWREQIPGILRVIGVHRSCFDNELNMISRRTRIQRSSDHRPLLRERD